MKTRHGLLKFEIQIPNTKNTSLTNINKKELGELLTKMFYNGLIEIKGKVKATLNFPAQRQFIENLFEPRLKIVGFECSGSTVSTLSYIIARSSLKKRTGNCELFLVKKGM